MQQQNISSTNMGARQGEQQQTTQEVNGLAAGFIVFASMMMILVGGFHVITGLIGIIDDDFYTLTRDYVFKFDATTWGWVHMVTGVIVAIAGFGLLTGALWARLVAIVAVTISALANFAFLPWYPVWSALMIAVDIGVIWALTFHGGEMKNI